MSYLLIAIAAIFNAFMDTVEHERYYSSKLRHWNARFWYKRESWKYCKRIGSYPVDAWHLAKSCMIISMAGAVVVYNGHGWMPFVYIGIVWNLTFNTFYNRIFK